MAMVCDETRSLCARACMRACLHACQLGIHKSLRDAGFKQLYTLICRRMLGRPRHACNEHILIEGVDASNALCVGVVYCMYRNECVYRCVLGRLRPQRR